MNTVFSLFGIVYTAVVLVAVGWGFYLMYLATRALQKYLRG
jgi:hypothetical protein